MQLCWPGLRLRARDPAGSRFPASVSILDLLGLGLEVQEEWCWVQGDAQSQARGWHFWL